METTAAFQPDPNMGSLPAEPTWTRQRLHSDSAQQVVGTHSLPSGRRSQNEDPAGNWSRLRCSRLCSLHLWALQQPVRTQRTQGKARSSSHKKAKTVATTKQLLSSASPQVFRQQQLLIKVKAGSFSTPGQKETFCEEEVLGHRRIYLCSKHTGSHLKFVFA